MPIISGPTHSVCVFLRKIFANFLTVDRNGSLTPEIHEDQPGTSVALINVKVRRAA